jgi:hypothetical protein
LVERQFNSFLKLIISFLVSHILLLSFELFKSYPSSLRSSMLLSLHTVSRLALGLSADSHCKMNTATL